MLPNFLVPETESRANGESEVVELGESKGRLLSLTLGITRIIEQESLDVTVVGSTGEEGAEFQTLISFPQKFYCGTYTLLPYDQTFFSIFQSVYIHYSETKNTGNPDYIATHAMIIAKELFQKSGGFNEFFMPILEDVEFSHRLKKKGIRLLMKPDIQVQHIFNFSLAKSMGNGIRKSKYWSIYSIKNRDLLADSGTASLEFKFNVLACFVAILLVLIGILVKSSVFVLPVLLLFGCNLFLNRNLLMAFHRVRGPFFAISAGLYYTLVYPFAVGIGVCSGIFSQHFGLRP